MACTGVAAVMALLALPVSAAGPLANEKRLYQEEDPVSEATQENTAVESEESLPDDPGFERKQLLMQRAWFLQAENAIREGDTEAFESLRERLEDYPLLPYLELRELQRRLFSAQPEEVAALLDRHREIPHSESVRRQWLTHLGRNGEWAVLREYASTPVHGHQLQCLVLRAQLLDQEGALRDKERAVQAMNQALPGIWLTGYSLPDSCDPLLSAWRDQGGLTDDLVWQRMRLALENHNEGLARYLQRYLPEEDREKAVQWLSVHRQPQRLKHHDRYQDDTELTRDILFHGLKRLIRNNPETAEPIWRQYDKSHGFSLEQRESLDRLLGLRLAVRYHKNALPWLKRASLTDPDPTLHEWQARVHLRDSDWKALLEVIQSMPQSLAQQGTWQYWQARGREALGDHEQAESLYQAVSQQRSFYGFLAADQLGRPYALNHQPFVADGRQIRELSQRPGIRRARELYELERLHHARSEWFSSLSRGDESELLAAAQLASHWGWHERSVMGTIAAQAWDRLELRFPLAYPGPFTESAREHKVDINWVYAMARQESAFMPDARSSRGALGLLQLLPGTAGATARQYSLPFEGHQSLLRPEINIRLGTAHLGQLLESFQGNRVLATAAYNAGEHRVRSWLEDGGDALATDIWLETMPYYETRQYVQNIMAYTIIYSDRRGQRVAGIFNQQELACACIE
ncbi:MAG: transglycosylase SLT domain-containing protein [Oleiphilaceae bacterium]|nr:transglycosylase SLT domain-containing protein [Oleiphilaceae bacterium]